MRVQSRSRAGRVKRRPGAVRGEDRRGGATIPAALEIRPFYARSLPVPVPAGLLGAWEGGFGEEGEGGEDRSAEEGAQAAACGRKGRADGPVPRRGGA